MTQRKTIPRLEALDLFDSLGAPISEKTLDRYRATGILTDSRNGMWIHLFEDEIRAVAAATLKANEEGVPLSERISRIEELVRTSTQ